jgi:hypothetical protein
MALYRSRDCIYGKNAAVALATVLGSMTASSWYIRSNPMSGTRPSTGRAKRHLTSVDMKLFFHSGSIMSDTIDRVGRSVVTLYSFIPFIRQVRAGRAQ